MLFSLYCIVVPRSDDTGSKSENEMVNHAHRRVTTPPRTLRARPAPAWHVVPRPYNTANSCLAVKIPSTVRFNNGLHRPIIRLKGISWALAVFSREFFTIFFFIFTLFFVKLWAFLNRNVSHTYNLIKNTNVLKIPLATTDDVLAFKFDNRRFHSDINSFH